MYTPSLREENKKAVGFTPLQVFKRKILEKFFSPRRGVVAGRVPQSLEMRGCQGDRLVTGFTLLELLIVIGIMVILGTVLVLVLNPAETLKKARDNQRITDLATVKTALGLYLTDISSPDLDAEVANGCLGGDNTAALIFYSFPETAVVACSTDVVEGADVDTGDRFSITDYCYTVGSALYTKIDGTGWIPVDLRAISGGSPLSQYPIDPTNTGFGVAPTSAGKMYRYACQQGNMNGTGDGKGVANVFELNAVLESTAYTSTDNKMAKDGGDNDNYYEVGTNVLLLPTGTNF